MFDYVIVGAGSAGCVLANRLSEDPSVRVLVLEAGGPDRQLAVRIPAAFPKLFRSRVDWAYTTAADPGVADRQLYWPRGKVLGGSSSMNAMIYSRGNRHDYDTWRDRGNPGWGFDDVLPYFKRAECQEHGASTYHGDTGPVSVADPRDVNPLSRAFVEAGVELGLPRNPDFNGADQDGVGFFQVTQRRGQRDSAATAYLWPVAARRNLTVRTGAQVTRLLLEGNRVIGVDVVQAGRAHRALATREVILSGGAINSPQLLLLSGIGPADDLHRLGIPVTVDLPGVGANLQDHLLAVVTYQCKQPISLATADRPTNLVRYLAFRRGPLVSNIAEAGAFLRTCPDLPVPDLEILFGPVYYLNHGFVRPDGHGFSLGAVLLHPRSRGRITLHSTDPLAPPRIAPSYLADPVDLNTLVEGVKLARQVAQRKAFDPYRGPEYTPGVPVRSDHELGAFIRQSAETCYHPIGTCRMGSDPLAVVDTSLRVHGVDGLRVVDASVIPNQLTGHPNAPTIMIAEKAADLILGRAPVPGRTPIRATGLVE